MTRIAMLLIALSLPAAAQRVSEPSSGLSVQPPAGYDAAITAPRPPNTAAIAIRRPGDTDTGCQVAWRPAPQNAQFTQAEMNAAVAGPTWRSEATRTLGAIYAIDHTEPFRHAGIEGFLLEGVIRMRQGMPARGKDVRTLFVILETPVGRTSAVCVGDRRDFAARRDEFLAIIRSTQSPARATPQSRPIKT